MLDLILKNGLVCDPANSIQSHAFRLSPVRGTGTSRPPNPREPEPVLPVP